MQIPDGYERCAPIRDFFEGEESMLAGHHELESDFEKDALEHIQLCEEAQSSIGSNEWPDVEERLTESLDIDEWQQHCIEELLQKCEGPCQTCPVGIVMRKLVGLEPFMGVQQTLEFPGSAK